MRDLTTAEARTGGGLEGEYVHRRRRRITFLASAQWNQVQRELIADLP